MEELRSTEILDKEIREDARRKASRILNNGIIECEKILENKNQSFENISKKKKDEYQKKIDDYTENRQSSIPLEKQRFFIEFINNSIDVAISQYIEKLSENQKLDIIKSMLKKYEKHLANKKIKAICSGFKKEDITKLLNQIFSKENVLSVTEADNKILESFKGCILFSKDSAIKCRATIEERIAEIKEQYSQELAFALFGGRLPE